MELRFFHFVIFTLLGATLSACGSNQPLSAPLEFDHRPLTGTFVENLDRVYAGSYLSECDRKFRDPLYILARKLDSRAVDPAALSSVEDRFSGSSLAGSLAEPQVSDPGRLKNLGGFQVYEISGSTRGKDEWISFSYGAEKTLADAAMLDEKSPSWKWKFVAERFGSFLGDDILRTNSGRGFAISHRTRTLLSLLSKALDACAGDSGCVDFPFSESELRWLQASPHYANDLETYFSTSGSGRRAWITHLASEVREEYEHAYFGFVNPAIIRTDSSLKVPMIAGDFTPYAEELAPYLVRPWQSENLRVEIEWRIAEVADFFRIIWNTGSNRREFVRRSPSEMHLFSGVNSRTLAHEFGHVLGLPDHYRTTWNDQTCEYTQTTNPSDLMSDSWRGLPLETDFDTLAKRYPRTGTL